MKFLGTKTRRLLPSTGSASSLDKLTRLSDSFQEKGVCFVERMPELAVSFGEVSGLIRIASKRVCSNTNWLHVGGVLANAVPAQVVDNQPLRDWSDQQFIREPMGNVVSVPSASLRKSPIAIGVDVSNPIPTGVSFNNSTPETFCLWSSAS